MTAIQPAAAGVFASRRRSSAAVVLGYDTKGSIARSFGNVARMTASVFTLGTSGTLRELHAWVRQDSPAGFGVRVVCYAADGGGGLPGTRLAYTNAIALTVGDQEIQQAGFSVAVTPGNYWIGTVAVTSTGTTGFCYSEDTGGTHQQISTGVPDPPPNPFGTPTTSGTRKYSCWAVVS